MLAWQNGVVRMLGLSLALFAAGGLGCGSGQSTSDAKIIQALDLKQAGNAYRIGGDPFCTVDDLLNDSDEVDQASDAGGASFLIASPSGDVGILARRPFAPDCTRKAKDDLKRVARKSG
jgi:hypothetical protein